MLLSSRDFQGKKIGVQQGSFAGEIVEKIGCEPVVFENDIQSFVQVLWNNIDAVLTEEAVGKFISKSLFNDEFVPVTQPVSSLEVVYLMRKTDAGLCAGVNQTIQKTKLEAKE